MNNKRKRQAVITKKKKKTNVKTSEKCPATDNKESCDYFDLLDSAFLVNHPKTEILSFWDYAKKLNPDKPTDAFTSLMSLKLVGPFDFLNGKIFQKPFGYYRYPTDLPEMQTLMIYDKGHFCYWRDLPTDTEPLLIHVSHSSENFPNIEIVGKSNLFSVFNFLIKELKTTTLAYKKLLPAGYDPITYTSLTNLAKQERSINSEGQPFHGLGMHVIVNGKRCYRDVTTDQREFKIDIETMATTKIPALKEKLRNKFFDIHAHVQYANDETDFGMGLEFGHDLFISNYKCFDEITRVVLKDAYNLMNRQAFTTILDVHYENGRRNFLTYTS